MELSNQVEQEILEAAEKVFYRKGKGAASMQDIADEAGITRTLLNYYFRSKDKLFDAVFRRTMSYMVPRVVELMNSNLPMEEFLPGIVEVFIDSMIEKPQIPIFVLQELTANPERVPQMMKELGVDPAKTVSRMKADNYFDGLGYDPRQFIMSILSLCIFPFAGKPMIRSIMYNDDEVAYIEAMYERKKLVPKILEQMLKIQ